MIKIRNIVLTIFVWLLAAGPAYADKISDVTADQVNEKIFGLIQPMMRPLGAIIIFVAIAITAVKIIITANNPEERARAMSALPYILGGGLLLGGAALIAGFVMGQYSTLGG